MCLPLDSHANALLCTVIRLVYRDIKLENFGFDIRGDIKVFDFGLCKSLSDNLIARDDKGRAIHGYNLTPRTGSLPYMAPEVAVGMPYDTKCDVFFVCDPSLGDIVFETVISRI
jgi:serine/threonine protein kinase